MPVKRNYPTYQPPNYRGMPGTTPPFIPEPIPQQGQVPPPSPIPPYMQQAPTGAQPQDDRTLMQKFKDPRFAGLLLSMGAALGQPRQFGQTGWGQAAQAMAQGYNFLGMSQAAQEAAKRQHWEDQIRMQELAMKQQGQMTDIENKKADTENKKNADIFKRDEGVREGRKVDIAATESEYKIQNEQNKLKEETQYHRDTIAARNKETELAMKKLDEAISRNATKDELDKLRFDYKTKFDAKQLAERAAWHAADAQYKRGMLGVAKQNADSNTTKAATVGTGKDTSNPEMIRLMGIVKNDPENFGISEEELVAKAQKLFDALPNKKSTPAGPKLVINGTSVTVDGVTYNFPSKEAAAKYVDMKSKERK